MKKSHRKDVIIARIIFACMVLVLVLVIVFAVKAVMKYRAAHSSQQPTVTTESQQPDENGGADTSADGTNEADEPDDNEAWIIEDTEAGSTEETGDDGEPGSDGDGDASSGTEQVTLQARYSVNIRSGAGKENPIVGGVEEGGTVILLEEEDNGWGLIQKDDITGYVYLEYFLILDEE